jgi:hypothetical protein
LFNIAVYLRKRFPEEWQGKVHLLNAKFMDPPLSDGEVQTIVKSGTKKAYAYRCHEPPINGVCNRQLCLTRPFGVAPGGDDPGVIFGDLTKFNTDPPMWILAVNGKNIELTTAQLLDPRQAQQRFAETANILMHLTKKTSWDKLMKEKIEQAEIKDVPSDVTHEGQWDHHLNDFCTGRAGARELDELLMGRAYIDPSDGRAYFRSMDFFKYMNRHYVKYDEKSIFKWLNRIKAKHHARNIKGKFTNYWSVGTVEQQVEEFDVKKDEVP